MTLLSELPDEERLAYYDAQHARLKESKRSYQSKRYANDEEYRERRKTIQREYYNKRRENKEKPNNEGTNESNGEGKRRGRPLKYF